MSQRDWRKVSHASRASFIRPRKEKTDKELLHPTDRPSSGLFIWDASVYLVKSIARVIGKRICGTTLGRLREIDYGFKLNTATDFFLSLSSFVSPFFSTRE